LAHGLRETEGELEKVWLVVDWPQAEEQPYHYYLAEFKNPTHQGEVLKTKPLTLAY